MKRILLLSTALVFAGSLYGQHGLTRSTQVAKKHANEMSYVVKSNNESVIDNVTVQPGEKVVSYNQGKSVYRFGDITDLQVSKYDVQGNAGPKNRAYRVSNGTMGVVATLAHTETFGDRGTGYNYFNGSEWTPAPEGRIEDIRTGFPTIVACGEGEIIFVHADAIYMMKRAQRGVGEWSEPVAVPGSQNYAWPKAAVTTDGSTEYIHLVFSNQNTQTSETDMLYTRSSDGGETWSTPEVLPGFEFTENDKSFNTDHMDLIVKGSTIVVLHSRIGADFAYLRSDDNGVSWEKHMIYKQFLEDFWTHTFAPGDTMKMFAPVGASGVLDKDKKLHVVFATCLMARDASHEPNYYSRWTGLGIDGIAYWNEDMGEIQRHEGFVNNLGSGTQATFDSTFNIPMMYEKHLLIGALGGSLAGLFDPDAENWSLWEGFSLDNLKMYDQGGVSTMPVISIDDNGRMLIVYSSILKSGALNSDLSRYYRRLFGRHYDPNSPTEDEYFGKWDTECEEITSDFMYENSEIIFPMFALGNVEGDQWNLFYNVDPYPGLGATSAEDIQHPLTDNTLSHKTIDKKGAANDEYQNSVINTLSVRPNPASNTAYITVSETSTITVFNMLGQVVEVLPNVTGEVSLEVSNYTNGVYMISARAANGNVSTQKLIVK